MAPFAWSGRSDGDGLAHRRFWGVVAEPGSGRPADAALVGFASDEGVRRNRGRVGAAAGPGAIRAALASLAVHEDLTVVGGADGEEIAEGDVVIYSKYGGTEVNYAGEDYLILSARDVLAVVVR